MARIRSIKPDFFNDETTAVLNPDAQLLLLGLATLADRDGLLEDRPRRIKAILFPYRDVDVEAHLEALVGAGVVQRYTASGQACIFLTTFSRDQKPHPKETSFGLPGPEHAEPGSFTASLEVSRQKSDASSRVPMVVGVVVGDGCGSGNGSSLPVASAPDAVKVLVGQAPLLPEAEAEKPKRTRKPPGKTTDSRHAPLVQALVDAYAEARGVPYSFRGRDARAVSECLAMADQLPYASGIAAHGEVLRRWRIGLRWRGYPACNGVHELAANWNAYAKPQEASRPVDVTRGGVRAEHFDHSRTGTVEDF